MPVGEKCSRYPSLEERESANKREEQHKLQDKDRACRLWQDWEHHWQLACQRINALIMSSVDYALINQ